MELYIDSTVLYTILWAVLIEVLMCYNNITNKRTFYLAMVSSKKHLPTLERKGKHLSIRPFGHCVLYGLIGTYLIIT